MSYPAFKFAYHSNTYNLNTNRNLATITAGVERSKVLLSRFDGAMPLEISGAEHACYVKPEHAKEFHDGVLTFLQKNPPK
jgi:hypothetical protein